MENAGQNIDIENRPLDPAVSLAYFYGFNEGSIRGNDFGFANGVKFGAGCTILAMAALGAYVGYCNWKSEQKKEYY